MSDHYDRYNGMENLLGTDLATKRTVKGFPIDADLLMLKAEEEYGFRARDRLYKIIRNMPKYEYELELSFVQPEIIYCKDCKHFIREDVEEYTPYGYNTHFHAFCDKHWDREQGEYIDVNLDDFCSFAERR